MEINFCKDCDNMLFLYTDDSEKLYHGCKACGNIEDMSSSDSLKCVYNNSQLQIDKSEIINTNEYITHDVTLPTIMNNTNIKCMNSECDSEETKITYIKYNDDDMKYLYICNHCGHKWKNNI